MSADRDQPEGEVHEDLVAEREEFVKAELGGEASGPSEGALRAADALSGVPAPTGSRRWRLPRR